MSKSDLLKELRARTQAGMKDCHDALTEANDDLEKAVDIIKTKGKNIVSKREGKVAAEGLLTCGYAGDEKTLCMLEVNCQTDFVARSDDFKNFAQEVLGHLICVPLYNTVFDIHSPSLQELRTDIASKTKENCVISNWWIEQVFNDNCKVYGYIHNGNKLGTIVSLQASSVDIAHTDEFAHLGVDLAMQVAAMSPMAVDAERLPAEVMARQRSIFETQLQELNKPQAQWDKIITGKFNKWYTEVCLLSQESIVVPKTSVGQVIKNVGTKLDGEIKVINFMRHQVGQDIETEQSDYLAEIAELAGGK